MHISKSFSDEWPIGMEGFGNISFDAYKVSRVGEDEMLIEFNLPGFDPTKLELKKIEDFISINSINNSSLLYSFSYRIPLLDKYAFVRADFVDNKLKITLCTREDKKPKDLPISIGAPTAASHPMLLNEDSDI